MEQKEIKRKLRQYASASKKIVPIEKESNVQKLLQIEKEVKTQELMKLKSETKMQEILHGENTADIALNTRGSVWTFIIEQLGYLGRYCLFWQAVWLAVFCYVMLNGVPALLGKSGQNGVLMAVSLLTPLLVLLTVEEVMKVYQRSMLEIEYATKYSLRSAVMVRMAALCAVHFLMLLTCIFCLHSRLESNAGRLLIYGITPMIIMTGIILKLMQHCQGETLRNVAAGVYLFMAVLVIAADTERFGWYQPICFKVWCITCVAGVIFDVWQFICLNKKLEAYEQIVCHE
ncbi:MAG: hypothetical protein NC433_06930 [Clostridiales bacterium]|nr:hypothetical protein [Clostridiales bacterium]